MTDFSCLINEDIPHLFHRIFPESLRWLLATQQYCRSKWIMGHIAKKNRCNMELDTDNILTGNEYIDTDFDAFSTDFQLFLNEQYASQSVVKVLADCSMCELLSLRP